MLGTQKKVKLQSFCSLAIFLFITGELLSILPEGVTPIAPDPPAYFIEKMGCGHGLSQLFSFLKHSLPT